MTIEAFFKAIHPFFKIIGCGIVSALFVGYFAHLLTRDRERIADKLKRKREFIGSVSKWRSKMAANIPTEGGGNVNSMGVFKSEFSKTLPDFISAVSLADGCFPRKRLQILTKQITDLNLNQNNEDSRKQFIDAIDALLHFLNKKRRFDVFW